MLMAYSTATQNILFKCVELGLGAVWLGLYPDDIRLNYTKEKLNIPQNIVPISLVAIGYSEDTKQRQRNIDSSKINFNIW